jgi:hypothetical protein
VLLYSSKHSLGVFQLAGHLLHIFHTIITAPPTSFLAPLPGIEEEEAPPINSAPSSFLAPLPRKSGRPLQGEFFARTSFTLFYCFALLYLFLLASFYQKPKKIRILDNCFYLSTLSFAEIANPAKHEVV